MTTSSVGITPGDGTKKAATYSVSEGGETREIQRLALNDSSGNDLGGSVSDAAYGGTGNGTFFSLLKWIGAGIASLVTASSSTAASNVTLGTQALTLSDGTQVVPKFAPIAASASGDTAVVGVVSGKKIRVLSYTLIANAAVNVKFRSNTTDKTGLLYLAANGGAAPSFSPVGIFETASGEALNVNLSGAVAVGGHLTYIEV